MTDDHALRAAAFAALSRLTAGTGGVVTRDQMTSGFDFAGERIAFAVERMAPGEAVPNQPHGFQKSG